MKSVIPLVTILISSFLVATHGQAKIDSSGSKTLTVNKEATLDMLNNARKEYAKKHRIPNMHKLTWDENLAMRAQTRDMSKERQSMRTARVDGDEFTEGVFKTVRQQYESDAGLQELVKSMKTYRVRGMEELVPHQKRVGCAPNIYVDSKMLVTHTLCFFEPEGNGESFLIPKGDPGSKCSSGYSNVDGLCALPAAQKSAAAAFIGTTEEPTENGATSHQFVYSSLMVVLLTWFL